MAPVKVGDSIPSIELMEGGPENKVNLADICKEGKIVIFGVPGAFTTPCSKTHLPGYVKDAEKIKGKGVKEIICVAVNDPFVMEAWGKEQKAEGKVRMLADPCAALAKAWDLELTCHVAILGNIRIKRFSMIVEDGKITQLNVEQDGTGTTCSLSAVLKI